MKQQLNFKPGTPLASAIKSASDSVLGTTAKLLESVHTTNFFKIAKRTEISLYLNC